VVIGCGTNATARKNNVTALKRIAQGASDATGIIADVMGIGQAQATLGQELNELGHVLIGTLTRENFISHNDEAKIGLIGCGHVRYCSFNKNTTSLNHRQAI
jgi:hypothetical protein